MVKFFVALSFLCSICLANELPIRSKESVNLSQEAQSLSLGSEPLLRSQERKKDRISLGARISSLDQITVKTENQNTTYDVTTGVSAGYTVPLRAKELWNFEFEGAAGYHRMEQKVSPIATALHIVPVSFAIHANFLRYKIKPYAEFGIQANILSQQGARVVKTSELDTTALTGVGILAPLPLDLIFDLKASYLSNLNSDRDWSGVQWTAAVATQI